MQIALQERAKRGNKMVSVLEFVSICIAMGLGVIMLFAGFFYTVIGIWCKNNSKFGAWCFFVAILCFLIVVVNSLG